MGSNLTPLIEMMRSCMSLISKEVNRLYQRNCIRSKQWKIQSCSFWLISCFHVFSSVLWYPPGLSLKNGVGIGLIPICLVGVRVFFKFIHVYWCPPRFPYQMMFVSFNSNTTDVISGAGIANYSGAPEFLVVFGFFSVQYLVNHCVSCCPVSSGHYIICPSPNYGFWFLKIPKG